MNLGQTKPDSKTAKITEERLLKAHKLFRSAEHLRNALVESFHSKSGLIEKVFSDFYQFWSPRSKAGNEESQSNLSSVNSTFKVSSFEVVIEKLQTIIDQKELIRFFDTMLQEINPENNEAQLKQTDRLTQECIQEFAETQWIVLTSPFNNNASGVAGNDSEARETAPLK